MREKYILEIPAKEFDFAKYTPDMLPEPKGKTYELSTNPGRKFEDPFDLDNLVFFDKSDAENLLRELEVICYRQIETGGTEKIVVIVGTGGTIAMIKRNGKLIPLLDSIELLNILPSYIREKYKAVTIQTKKMVDSSELPPDIIADTVILASATWRKMSASLKKRFAGFVITHGTDTMSDSAALFRMMLGRNVPFNTAFVGAQKTIEDDLNDVSANLTGVLSCLGYAHDDSNSYPENKFAATHHFVFMNGSSGAAMNQTGISKVSDNNIMGFISPMHPDIISYAKFGATGIRALTANLIHSSNEDKFRPLVVRGYVNVEKILAEQGRDPEMDRAHVKAATSNRKSSGIVLVTYGSFTFHPANLSAILEAANVADVPVFVANPFASGSTEHNYGPAINVRKSGAEPVHMMPAAVRAKIHIGNAMFGSDRENFLTFMRKDYVGEMPEEYPDLPPIGQTRSNLWQYVKLISESTDRSIIDSLSG